MSRTVSHCSEEQTEPDSLSLNLALVAIHLQLLNVCVFVCCVCSRYLQRAAASCVNALFMCDMRLYVTFPQIQG